MKTATKKKLTAIRQTRNRTGGQPANINLSSLDNKIISIIGLNNLAGDMNLGKLGFGSIQQCNDQKYFIFDTLLLPRCFFHFSTK